jgi:type VI secretion system protein ImpG
MKNIFLNYYNNELYYLREMAEEFAKDNPQIAQQLSLAGFTCADPYIERLLEGFAYLAARVHYQLDSDFSKFTQALINNIYPDYLMPFPSVSVVQFMPDFNDNDILKGVTIPRHTSLKTLYRSTAGTPCNFTTANEVILWPIKINTASYTTEGIYTAHSLGINKPPKASLSLKLTTEKGIKFKQLDTDHLDFYLCGASMKVLMDLYEQIFTDLLAVVIEFKDKDGNKCRIKLKDIEKQVQPLGFGEEQSLLPVNLRNYQEYRLLKEYFVFPQKFLFFRLLKLQDAFKQVDSDSLKVVFVMKNENLLLETSISGKNFSLYSTPVINIFEKRLDRLSISDRKVEYQVNADNSKLHDYEILQINKIEAYNNKNDNTLLFKPFYQVSEYDNKKNLYYSINRRLIQEDENHKLGTDTYISLLDIHSLYYEKIVSELAITALCSNRAVPSDIPVNTSAKTDFFMSSQFPIKAVKLIERPTKPNYTYLNSVSDWTIVNHLKVSYKNILDKEPHENTEILQELLKLYACSDKLQDRKQIKGLTNVKVEKGVMRIEAKDGVSFGSGLNVELEFNENQYGDSGFFILSHILHKVISCSTPVNTVLKTKTFSNQRGEIKKWKTSPI